MTKSLPSSRVVFGAVFVSIGVLVAGGLAWLTGMVLSLDRQQRLARAEGERNARLRLALWRLDARLFPVLAREANRPVSHYSVLASVPGAFVPHGTGWRVTDVLQPSPLLDEPRPAWLLLHFQVAAEQVPLTCESPQVPSEADWRYLQQANLPLASTSEAARRHLDELRRRLDSEAVNRWLAEQRRQTQTNNLLGDRQNITLAPAAPTNPMPATRLALSGESGGPQPDQSGAHDRPLPPSPQTSTRLPRRDPEFDNRAAQRSLVEQSLNNIGPRRSQMLLPSSPTPAEPAQIGPLRPWWLTEAGQPRLLLFARWVQIGPRNYCQGILIDHQLLARELAEAVSDLFPKATLVPQLNDTLPRPEQTMAAVPFVLEPNEPLTLPAPEGWSTLHVGLWASWLAGLLALTAVGLGGWSLLELSERRIRFVSAVTHELRTPLTTLRLYADMLHNGLVTDADQQQDYIRTLQQEAERLHRLIANVLDYSRLERKNVPIHRTTLAVAGLLEEIERTWSGRCQDADKTLVLESSAPPDLTIHTDADLVHQIIGNLLDNACKYSQGSADKRIWLRSLPLPDGAVAIEVEDRGPGVAPADARRIFAAFQRGTHQEGNISGVGLGLALAERWARLLGGRLEILAPASPGPGVRFRLTLPLR